MYGFNHRQTRPATNKLIDMMDEGLIDARAVADMALCYMSEDQVADMMRSNDIIDEEADEDEEPEEEWTPDNADFNDKGSRHHY